MNYPGETPRWRRYLTIVRRDASADVDDELRFHFESRLEELTTDGMNVDDARAQAIREFGDVGEVRQNLVDIGDRVAHRKKRIEWLADLASDISYGVRTLRRTPGVALGILLTLALGVGANAAMFTLLDTIYLRPPAGVLNPESVRRVWMQRNYTTGIQFGEIMSYVQFDAIRSAVGDRGHVVVYGPPGKARLGSGEQATEIRLSTAGADYFSLLGVRPLIGRFFAPDEDRIDATLPVVVLSESYWKRTRDADQRILGKEITINGIKATVVGVAGKGFTGTELSAADAWMPLSYHSDNRGAKTPWWRNTRVNGLFVVVKPNPGVSEPALAQRITVALRNPDVSGGKFDSNTVVRFGSIVAANGPGMKSKEEQIATRLVGVSMIVLIIACANVVNLLLARAVRRRREIAIRLALGVARGRLLRLLLAESGVLAALAAALAVLVAYWGGAVLRAVLLPDVHWDHGPLDARVVALALATALGAGLIAGLIPALQSASPELTSSLRIGTGSEAIQNSRLRSSLVIAQSALSVTLLVGALLFVKSLSNVRHLDIGFDAASVVTVSARLDDHPASDSTFVPRIRELAERLKTVPGVEGVALSSMQPMGGFSFMSYFTDRDSSGSRPGFFPTFTGVSRGYFAVTGIRILRGGDFAAQGAPSRSVIVNETMARTLWQGREAIGQCIRFGTRSSPCFRVSAVVEDARRSEILEKENAAQFYLSFEDKPDSARYAPDNVTIRVSPARFEKASNEIRSLVRAEFPGAIPSITRLSDYIDPQYRPWRLGALLFSGLGLLALVVAVVGIYSTVSYGVNQRIHEFGVRIALGASVSDVLKIVVGAGLRTVAIGVAIGVFLSILAGRLIASMLYGVEPKDPAVLATVALTLVVISVMAALAPAWRASRIDPVTALRAD
jgi:putative ABC transport system permease protein